MSAPEAPEYMYSVMYTLAVATDETPARATMESRFFMILSSSGGAVSLARGADRRPARADEN